MAEKQVKTMQPQKYKRYKITRPLPFGGKNYYRCYVTDLSNNPIYSAAGESGRKAVQLAKQFIDENLAAN